MFAERLVDIVTGACQFAFGNHCARCSNERHIEAGFCHVK